MAGERPGHSLQATALVNEAYLRLVNAKMLRGRTARISWPLPLASCGAFSWTMRAHASIRSAAAAAARVTLDEALVVAAEPDQDFVALDEALTALAAVDARKSQVVEMRFFGGLTLEETAEALQVSRDTVKRDWKMAKLWLLRELRGGKPDVV